MVPRRGFDIGGDYPPTDPRAGLYNVVHSMQSDRPITRAWEGAVGHAKCRQTAGFPGARVPLFGLIL